VLSVEQLPSADEVDAGDEEAEAGPPEKKRTVRRIRPRRRTVRRGPTAPPTPATHPASPPKTEPDNDSPPSDDDFDPFAKRH
jgi:hypothetical protein